ncbi:MAG: hypothetical protein WBA57_13660 [Elainellaceae cyanobacterium]
MKRFRSDWHRTFVHPISKIFVSAVGELSGLGRRRRPLRDGSLAAALAERDRLSQEMQDLVQYTDAEIEQLKQTIEHLRYERDALQMQVWLLEEQVGQDASVPLPETAEATVTPSSLEPNPIASALASDLADLDVANSDLADSRLAQSDALIGSEASSDLTHQEIHIVIGQDASQSQDDDETALISIPRLDLSGLRLALIGGHPSTRRGVIQELQLNYGLRHVVEIPRMTESNTNRSKVKSKIGRCTLVVLITGYMSHRLTEIVYSLKDAGSLAGEVLQLNCRGKSGVVREILNHVTQAEG